MDQVNGRKAIFDPPPTATWLLNRMSWNLKYITTSEIALCMQNFRMLRRRGWSGKLPFWRVKCFVFFLLCSSCRQVASFYEPHAKYVIRRSCQRRFGGHKDDIWL